jgi:hypothetical protein
MSYAKAMKHHNNIKKCKKQSNMFMGFDTGTVWKNTTPQCFDDIRRWFKERNVTGNKSYIRECIREQIALARIFKATT